MAFIPFNVGVGRLWEREVNRMLDSFGTQPDEIVVEMAREMSLGLTRRNEREKENANNRRARLDLCRLIFQHAYRRCAI